MTAVPAGYSLTSGRRLMAVMRQEWRELTFLHWRWDAGELARRLPPGLELDLYEGSAWLGLTPFSLRGLRPPLLPPLPWISRFAETNLRTYVRGPDGVGGIWFFSLECARLAAVLGARASYGLPYRWSRMRVRAERTAEGTGAIAYESRRRWPGPPAFSRIRVEIGAPMGTGTLEAFLTARFRLFALRRGRLWHADVDHAPWPLRRARLLECEQTISTSLGLDPGGREALVFHADGVATRIGRPRAF